MKKLLFLSLLFSISLALFAASNPLAGKTLTGKTKTGTHTFVFSKDGQKATLDSEYNHTFVKEVNGVFLYQGSFKGTKHFDAFKVLDAKTVLVAAPSSQGQIRDTIKDFGDPDKVAANIDKLGVKYTMK